MSLRFPSSSVPSVVENAVSQFQQRSTQQQPKWDTHHADPDVRQLLQAGAESHTEGQLEEQGRQVPQPPLHALLLVPGVKVRLAATRHLHDLHEDQDGVEGPDGEEDEEPVPVDFRVQLEDEHDEEEQGEDPGEEDSLSKGHLHLGRWRRARFIRRLKLEGRRSQSRKTVLCLAAGMKLKR